MGVRTVKRSRRDFLRVAVTTTAAGVLAACGAQTPSGSETTVGGAAAPSTEAAPAASGVPAPSTAVEGSSVALALWSMRSPEQLKLVQRLVDQYQEQTGNRVTMQAVPFADAYDKFSQGVREGTAPDAADFMAHPWIITWAEAGLIAPAPDDLLTAGELAELPQGWERACKYEGKQISFPYVASHMVFIHNKEFMPEAPATQEELIAVASGLNEGQRQGFIVSSDYWHVHSYWSGFGAYAFKETPDGWDWNDIGFATPEGIEAGKWIQRMAKEGAIPTTVGEVRGSQVQSLMTDKLVASAYSGQWAISDYLAAGLDVGVTSLPKLPNGNIPVPFLNYDVDTVAANSKQPAEAWDLVKSICLGIQDLMVDAGQVPITKSALEAPKARQSPIIKGFLQQFPEHVMTIPAGPKADTMFEPMTNAVGLIAKGEDVETTLKQAVESIKKAIAEIG